MAVESCNLGPWIIGDRLQVSIVELEPMSFHPGSHVYFLERTEFTGFHHTIDQRLHQSADCMEVVGVESSGAVHTQMAFFIIIMDDQL